MTNHWQKDWQKLLLSCFIFLAIQSNYMKPLGEMICHHGVKYHQYENHFGLVVKAPD